MKLYRCDRCKADVPDEDDERGEWTAIGLAKVSTPTAPFQRSDLCEDCTTGLRHWLATPLLQGPLNARGVVPGRTKS